MRALALVLVLSSPLVAAAQEIHSEYVEAEDGVLLAVDVILPSEQPEPLPALFEITRYWRASEHPRSGERLVRLRTLDRALLEAGYVLVKVDARGSGASFGSRLVEYGPDEIDDGWALVEWAVQQNWCDGSVGAYGTSYSGTMAEFLAASEHPALKAVIPGWSDFDVWRSPARPYGLTASGFLSQWSRMVGAMDRNDATVLGARVCRVDADEDGSLRDAAVEEHAENPTVLGTVRRSEFRDDPLGASPYSFADSSSRAFRERIEGSGAAMLVFASWLDAGTAEGALRRFQHYRNPQHVVILASNHGGAQNASPYRPSGVSPLVNGREQIALQIAFFDHHLKGIDNEVTSWPLLRYHHLGESVLRESAEWPLPDARPTRWFFRDGHALDTEAPSSAEGSDEYPVDPGVSTGRANRWFTQMGAAVGGLDDRAAMNERMLVYTSEPLPEALDITGTPIVRLHLCSNRTDGAFLVYLEDVAPDGQVRYVTEGGLRGVHRRITDDPDFAEDLPFHSFARADAQPLVPGEPFELQFTLWPTSVHFAEGHRIRIALAGADADTFDPIPAEGETTWTISVNAEEASWIELPVVR